MRLPLLALSLALSSTAVAATAVPADGVRAYALTPTDGGLRVVVRHDPGTLLAAMGHDHVVGATGWSGTVAWPASGVAGCRVELALPVAGLRADPPGLRTKVGLGGEGETSDRDKAKIEENLRGDRQLDVARFPTIAFRATTCAPKGDQVAVTGALTVHGVTRTVTALVDVTATDASFRARGRLAFDGSDFGVPPFTALGGSIRNLDRLELSFDVDGRPTG